MLLAIDIGNTTITLGVVQNGRVKKVWNIETVLPEAELKVKLQAFVKRFKKHYAGIKGILICSVVPKVLKIVDSIAERALKINPLVVGRDILVWQQ